MKKIQSKESNQRRKYNKTIKMKQNKKYLNNQTTHATKHKQKQS